MRNKRNTCTQSRVKATRQAGTRSARFFFYFLKHKNANKETMRQFVCCRFYQQSIITNQVNTCVHDAQCNRSRNLSRDLFENGATS